MSISRRNVLKMGAALAAVPLVGDLRIGPTGAKVFSTGSPELDHALGGGMRLGSVLAVVGPRGSGKSAFLLRLAKANGILDSYPMGAGTSDMLSIMEREDGRHIGSLMLDAAEPATPDERSAMAQDPAARDAFLGRWFQRTRDVTHESGGLFAISVCDTLAPLPDAPPGTSAGAPATAAATPAWLAIPDYIITLHTTPPTLLRSPRFA